jgi:hypothetical protein
VAAGGKATAALWDGVVGGGVMDGGIGMGSGKMRIVLAARTTESSGMVRGVSSGRQQRREQRRRRCGAAPLVVGSGGGREVSIWMDVELQSFYSSG